MSKLIDNARAAGFHIDDNTGDIYAENGSYIEVTKELAKFAEIQIPDGYQLVRIKAIETLAKLAKHDKNCSWATELPTGQGYFNCSCGLDSLVLDGEFSPPINTEDKRCLMLTLKMK